MRRGSTRITLAAISAPIESVAQNEASCVTIDAKAKVGEMLAQMALDGERARGSGRGVGGNTVLPPDTPKLADLSVSKIDSQRWQAVAKVPEVEKHRYFNDCLADGEEIRACIALSIRASRITAKRAGR